MNRKIICLLIFLSLASGLLYAVAPQQIRFISPINEGTWLGVQRIHFELRNVDPKKVISVEVFLEGKFLREFKSPPYDFSYDFGQVPKKSSIRVVVYGSRGVLLKKSISSYPYDAVEEVHVLQVVVPVVVTDKKGNMLTHLKEEDFIILADGVEQKINSYSRGGGVDFHLALLIDISSSMSDKIGKVRDAATIFLKQVLTKKDEACLIFFNHDTFEDTDFTNSVDDLINSMSMIFPYGKTALYDAIAHCLKLFRGIQGRNIVILYTDGEDNSSYIDPYTLIKQAERSNAVIYSIGPKVRQFGDMYWELLKEISASSGGLTFSFTNIDQIEGFYSKIKQDIRTQYILQFSPKAIKKLNRFRKILVKLKDRKDYNIRTIKGYFY